MPGAINKANGCQALTMTVGTNGKYRPEAAGAYMARARAYVRLGKLDEAIADFTKSIELSPCAPHVYKEMVPVS
jgi:Flp pilus assembly protein TadD